MNSELISNALKTLSVVFIILQISPVFISVSYAGKLHDFEEDSVFKRDLNKVDSDSEDQAYKCGIIWILLSACGDQSSSKESTDYLAGMEQSNPNYIKPSAYFRADAIYQTSETDVSSINFDLQGIKNSFGFRTKLSKFSETTPNDDLSYIQFHGLYKPQATNNFDVAMGLGIGVLRGEQNTSGLSLYVPIYYKLNSMFSLEASGSITRLNRNPIIDTRMSVSSRYKHIALILSYLALISPEESIHGPSLGISVQIGR